MNVIPQIRYINPFCQEPAKHEDCSPNHLVFRYGPNNKKYSLCNIHRDVNNLSAIVRRIAKFRSDEARARREAQA